ncbi:nuclear transport factor 2 family protein [Streptococcus merionis]|uniref:nuclear transport factor 2 family protein n=1 Tax=Streptococcus merionis TaxID=400065 RepID=UPI00351803A6
MMTVQETSQAIKEAILANDMTAVVHLVADNARFVHMGITFDKASEFEVFNTKKFIYKSIEVAKESVEDYGNTAIIYRKLKLTAVVNGNEVTNPFVVSEVFTRQTGDSWQMVASTYTRIAADFDDYQLL